MKFIASPSLFPVSNIPSHDYKAKVHLRTKLRIPVTETKSMHFNCSTVLPPPPPPPSLPLFVSRIVLTSYLAEGVGTKDSVLREYSFLVRRSKSA